MPSTNAANVRAHSSAWGALLAMLPLLGLSGILTISPCGGIVVLEAMVAHPSAASYVRRMAKETATRPSCARWRSTASQGRRRWRRGLPDRATGDAVVGRLGREGAYSWGGAEWAHHRGGVHAGVALV